MKNRDGPDFGARGFTLFVGTPVGVTPPFA